MNHARIPPLRALAVLIVVLAVLYATGTAFGQNVESIGVYTDTEVRTQRVVGVLGEELSGGFGFAFRQGIRIRSFTGALALGTDYYLTRQDPPPFDSGLRTFGISAELGYALRLSRGDVSFGGEYGALFLRNNSIVEATGPETTLHLVGAVVRARFFIAAPLYMHGAATYRSLPGTNTAGHLLGLSFGIGIEGVIRNR